MGQVLAQRTKALNKGYHVRLYLPAGVVDVRQEQDMSILSRLFGRKHELRPDDYIPPRGDRVDVLRGFNVQANSDIISGYQFCATIQLRTPLRVLRRHGEIHKGISSDPPLIAREMWEGIWIPVTRSFRDLGFDLDEPIPGTMASDVGPISADGGDYLRFLLAVREAAESEGSIEDRRAWVANMLRDPAWREPVRALNGVDAILDHLFPSFVSMVPRMPAKVGAALIDADFASPEAINAASDKQLRAISGLGPGLLAALRLAAGEATEPAARFADEVIR